MAIRPPTSRGKTTNKFKGIAMLGSAAVVPPDYALDCLNVLPSNGGFLEKARVPTSLADLGTKHGPTSMDDFQQATGVRQIIAADDTKLFYVTIPDYLVVPIDDKPAYGVHTWSMIELDNVMYLTNGQISLKWIGTSLQLWGIDRPTPAPIAVVGGAGTNNFTVSCSYAYSYKNSVLGGESNVSDATLIAGPVVNKVINATALPSIDNQVDTICWYKTLDGGNDLFLIGEFALPGGLNLADNSIPTAVNQSQFAPLYNAPPLNGRYVATFQGRVFIGNITGAPQDIIYSAYERIFRGRPPECFPQFNRLRLAIGADDIRGIGVIQAGVVAFSRSNEMYMLRGVVEDVVTSAPVAFSAFLEQLPWQIGVSSHWSIQSTSRGLLFLGSDFNVYNFNGVAEPISLAPGLAPLLSQISTQVNENIRSAYFSYCDRDWYCLLVPIGGTILNRLVFIDMTEEPAVNVGAFICDVVADSIAVTEDGSGGRKLVIGRGGVLYEFKALSAAINGIVPTGNITMNADDTVVLDAYWRSGYFGGDAPDVDKMFRYLSLITSIEGFGVILRVIDDVNMAEPEIWPVQDVIDGYASINWKAKRISVEIQFPKRDVDCSVLELIVNVIHLTSRPSGGA